MNRAQGRVVGAGAMAIGLILLFPAWCTRAGYLLKIELGRAWVMSPPARLGPEDFRLSEADGVTKQVSDELARGLASAYRPPEIDWDAQGYFIGGVLMLATMLIVAFRGPNRSTKKDPRLQTAEQVFRIL